MSERKILKFNELSSYIVENCGKDGVLETKLWKLLYFSEADYFRKYGKTITGVDYFKNNFGPTPDKKIIDKSINDLKDYIKIEKKETKDGRKFTLYTSTNNFPLDSINANEIETVRETCDKYSDLSTTDISLLSHKDPPYLIAKIREKIKFDNVVYREEDIEETPPSEEKYTGNISDESAKRLLSYANRFSKIHR